MRDLYAIPTRCRKSKWYQLDGDLRLAIEQEEPGSLRDGTADFKLPNGQWIRLLPTSDEAMANSDALKHIWTLLGCPDQSVQQQQPGRVLLRRVERQTGPEMWDILVSPSDDITVSIADIYEYIKGEAGFEELREILFEGSTSIDWPAWIPNDESLPTPPIRSVSIKDQELWEALTSLPFGTFSLEKDQIFWDLDLSLLEADSIDIVQIVMGMEEIIELEIPDDVIEQLKFEEMTLGELYLWFERFVNQIKNK